MRICTRCVMDESDPELTFDGAGVCSLCHARDRHIAAEVKRGDAGRAAVDAFVAELKRAGQGREFDCVIGVSGGVDSSYVAWTVVRKLGLRPLAVHLDNGWNTELATANIERVVQGLGIPLETVVLDWDEFRDLQLSFLRASTPDSEVPTDHAIVAALYAAARGVGVRDIIGGENLFTETHLPRAWSQGHHDWQYIFSIHRKFGSRPLKSFPHRTYLQQELDRRSMRWTRILNWLDVDKSTMVSTLERELGWRPYKGKHHESIYTRFYQGYLLPRKFGFDKRKAHLSSLVCSGALTRAEALTELAQPPYPVADQESDRVYVAKKLGITDAALDEILALPPRRFDEFPSYANSAWPRWRARAGTLRRRLGLRWDRA